MKKIKSLLLTVLFFALISLPAFSTEVQIRLLPSYSYFQKISNISAGGILSFDIAPIKFRTNDNLIFSGQGSFFNLFEDGISSEQYIDYNLAFGYSMRISDRLYVYPEAFGGLWTIRENKNNELPPQNGFFYGGRLNLNFHILPELDVSLFGGYKALQLPKRFISNTVHAGIGITYNFSKGLRYSSNIEVTDADL